MTLSPHTIEQAEQQVVTPSLQPSSAPLATSSVSLLTTSDVMSLSSLSVTEMSGRSKRIASVLVAITYN